MRAGNKAKQMIVNILIADDHGIAREGVASLIRNIVPDVTIFQAANFDMALEQLKKTPMQLVICDIKMPGANNFQIIDSIQKIQPDTKILVLSAYKRDIYAQRYLDAGANAYLDKNFSNTEIQDTILALLQHTPLPVINIGPDTASPLARLSDRELEVAQLFVSGCGVLEVSNALNIRSTTVSTYKSRIYEKLGIASIPDLVAVFNNYA